MFTITPRGPFTLAESAGFPFIDRGAGPRRPEMRLAFCRDGSWEPTGAVLRQDGDAVTVHAPVAVRGQVERILALDVDATTFADVGERDPVIGRLQAAAPGLRPPLLHSAYEAAVFCILTARRSSAQARATRTRLAEHAGTVLDVAGRAVACTPPPAALNDLLDGRESVPGLDPVRRDRLRGVARAALEGELDTATLRAMDPVDARAQVQTLAGIGPFMSAIIVVRALGHTDVMLGTLTELNATVGSLYGLGHDATAADLERISAPWAPWRTWAQVYLRAVSDRLPDAGGAAHDETG